MNFTSPEYFLVLVLLAILVRIVSARFAVVFLALFSVLFYAGMDLVGLQTVALITMISYLGGVPWSYFELKIRKAIASISIFLVLSIFIYYKYAFFVVGEWKRTTGNEFDVENILAPIGISFCSFQAMSYLIDVRRGSKGQKNLIHFVFYIFFFPQMLAGPIERAKHIFRQLEQATLKPVYRPAIVLILLGVAKKLVVADNLAVLTDMYFKAPPLQASLSSTVVTLMGYTVSLRYYFDFSAYSDIALGSGLLLGFHLHRNFRFPFLATTPRAFWQAWHITLGKWFRDYVMIPLQKTSWGQRWPAIVILTTFVLIGMWHGANWTFAVFGLFQGFWYIAYEALGKGFRTILPTWVRVIAAYTVMHFIFFSSGLIFAASDLSHLKTLITYWWNNSWSLGALEVEFLKTLLVYILPLAGFEVLLLRKVQESKGILPMICVVLIGVYYCLLFGNFSVKEFLYFNF